MAEIDALKERIADLERLVDDCRRATAAEIERRRAAEDVVLAAERMFIAGGEESWTRDRFGTALTRWRASRASTPRYCFKVDVPAGSMVALATFVSFETLELPAAVLNEAVDFLPDNLPEALALAETVNEANPEGCN